MNSYHIKEQCWSISLYTDLIVKFIPSGSKCCSPSNSFWRKLSTLQKQTWCLDDLDSVPLAFLWGALMVDRQYRHILQTGLVAVRVMVFVGIGIIQHEYHSKGGLAVSSWYLPDLAPSRASFWMSCFVVSSRPSNGESSIAHVTASSFCPCARMPDT